jgi:hypothetical protein
VGVLNEGNMGKWTDVQSSWGYSFGANLFVGYQASTNSSGTHRWANSLWRRAFWFVHLRRLHNYPLG